MLPLARMARFVRLLALFAQREFRMRCLIWSIALLVVLSQRTHSQEAAEPQRIQRAAFDAKPIDQNPTGKQPDEAASPAVDVPVQQLGKQFRLLGRLNLPLGEVVRVQGIIVRGPEKAFEDGLNVRAYRINGQATQQSVQIKLVDYYGRDELPLQPGVACELEGFETGGFVGVPAEALKRGGTVTQTSVAKTTGHQFVHEFKVIQATEIKFQPFTPADFLGREMLVQGQAVSESGSAYIAGNKWKLLVDNGTPWPKNSEGKTVEARGVIRTIGKTTTYRLENGGKNNNARLVNLADQIGKAVTLRGTVIEKNGQTAFRYRGQLVNVDGLKNLIAQTGLHDEAQLSGTLDVVRSTTQGFNGEAETHTEYIVRKATLKPTDPLLAIERAESVE